MAPLLQWSVNDWPVVHYDFTDGKFGGFYLDYSACLTFAGHLPQKQQDYRKKYRTLASTYMTFGPDGSELLVNIGGEQIYLFDVSNKRRPQRYAIGQQLNSQTRADSKGRHRCIVYCSRAAMWLYKLNFYATIFQLSFYWCLVCRPCCYCMWESYKAMI